VGVPAPAAAPPGTKVVVRDLFSLTPARREFLKSGKAELARVSAFLTQIALGWPHVGFSLRHDARDLWTLPTAANPVDRLETVFGRDARGALLEVDAQDGTRRERVRGFISRPGRDRPSRNGQTFFVNGRLVRSAALAAAWLAGYGSFGMTGRYPFGALSIDVPPEDVDVNVHPTKIEVRFAFPQPVFDAVRSAVAQTLRESEPARAFTMPGRAHAAVDLEGAYDGRGNTSVNGAEPTSTQISFAPSAAPSSPRALGQIERTFILIQTAEEILVLDQHAAHERIAYEALIADTRSGETVAPLLFPTIVELSPAHASALHDCESDLAAAGIEIEPFGDGAVRIRALPAGYESRRFDLVGILDDLAAEGAAREGIAHRNRVLATIACHSVIRAGEPLSLQEQSALYERLLACREPQTCPHGRPTMLRLNGDALARAFKRM
jgi:DNA mismatch repair protein MutL